MSIFGSRCVQISFFLKSNVWFSHRISTKKMICIYPSWHIIGVTSLKEGVEDSVWRCTQRSEAGFGVPPFETSGKKKVFLFEPDFGGNVVVVGLFFGKSGIMSHEEQQNRNKVYFQWKRIPSPKSHAQIFVGGWSWKWYVHLESFIAVIVPPCSVNDFWEGFSCFNSLEWLLLYECRKFCPNIIWLICMVWCFRIPAP